MKVTGIVLLLVLLIPVTALAVPEYINYQARIFDATGHPMQGVYEISFGIYDATGTDASATENLVWGPFVCDGGSQPGHASKVTVSNGWFNVILGQADVLGRQLQTGFLPDDGTPRFIEIQVQGEVISPRQQFLAAPYAMESRHAHNADYATYAVHGDPPGSVQAYFGDVAPLGWLLCDGSPIPAGQEFDALRALVGANTPDLRGRVILMADPTAAVLSASPGLGTTGGEEQHTLTVNEMPSHNHAPAGGFERLLRISGANTVKYADNSSSEPDIKVTDTIQATGGGQAHNNMQPFIALNWIIKY